MSEFLTYENSHWGISMRYPSDWLSIPTGHPDMVVRFLAPTTDTLNVVVQNLPPGTTCAKYAETITNLIAKSSIDFNLIENSQSTLSGHAAVRIVYTATESMTGTNKTLKIMRLFMIKDDKAYVITASLSPLTPSATIQNVMDSFQLMK